MESQQQGSVWVFVLFGVVFVGMAALIIGQKIKRKGAQWTGVVIDKNMTESVVRDSLHDRDTNSNGGLRIGLGGVNNAVQRSYQLRIRDDAGKEFNWPVGEGVYQSVNVGDKLQKQPGTETPVVLSQAQPAPTEQALPQTPQPVQMPQVGSDVVQPQSVAPAAPEQSGQSPVAGVNQDAQGQQSPPADTRSM